jgi:protein HIRA/HIR1
MKVLSGHEADVCDIAWSPEGCDPMLASCGFDAKIRIWDGETFGYWMFNIDVDTITIISSHTLFVKGIAWDPAGKFIASQRFVLLLNY